MNSANMNIPNIHIRIIQSILFIFANIHEYSYSFRSPSNTSIGTTFSLPEQGGLESYQYDALKFIRGIRVNKKHPISVLLATADNRLFAIKQVSTENNEPGQEY